MPALTPELLYLFRAGILTDFDQAYRAARAGAPWSTVAGNIPTTLRSQDYAWLGAGATMEEVVDEPHEQSFKEGNYTLADKLYKARLVIPRRDIEDENYGLIQTRVADIAQAAQRHSDKIVFQSLTNGFTTICHDGQYFFDSDHAESGSNQTNTTSASLSDAALETADQSMQLFVDDNGDPRAVQPDTLVVGPKLQRKAMDLISSDVVVSRVGDGTASTGATASTPFTNFFQGRYKLIISPWITGYNWFLLDASKAIKPLILQTRSDVPMSVEDDFTQPSSMQKEKFLVDVRERKVAGYGPWFYAYGSNASS